MSDNCVVIVNRPTEVSYIKGSCQDECVSIANYQQNIGAIESHCEGALVFSGVQGPSGAVVGGENYLARMNRLSEFDTDQAKADARANIGLAVIDAGTF